MMPRDVQNANSLIFSQINLNKYSWNEQGEKILMSKELSLDKDKKRILKFLFLKKIPENRRGPLWLLSSGAKREMLNNPEYYQNLTEKFPRQIPSPYSEQIEADLHRTFPEELYFMQDCVINKLRNILLAYSRRNISIGYCQGFNFIVGRLLRVFESEEEAFWVFVQIIEQILPLNYFSNMAGAMVDCAIFTRLFQLYLPDLYSFLIEMGFEMHLNTIIFKWFVGLYANYLPEHLCFIILDVLFLEGCITLFKSAIGIFKTLKKEIMSQTSIESIQNILENEVSNFIDPSSLIYYTVLRRFEFDIEMINKNRDVVETNIIDNYFKKNQEKVNLEKNKLIEDCKTKKINELDVKRNSYFVSADCHVEWPLCIFDTYYKHDITKFLVFKNFNDPVVIENYFFGFKNLKNNSNWIPHGISSEFCSYVSFNGSLNSNEISQLFEKEEKSNSNSTNMLNRRIRQSNLRLKRENDNCRYSVLELNEDGQDEGYNEENFNLIIEDNSEPQNLLDEPDDQNSSYSCEIFEKCGKNEKLDKFAEKYDQFNFIEENRRLQTFKNILIERRPHFCLLFPQKVKEKELLNISDVEKITYCMRNTINYSIKKKNLGGVNNKSFTALHPYFNETNDALKFKSGLIFSHLISDIRQSSKHKENNLLLESLNFSVKPFRDDDFDNTDNDNYEKEGN